jgi:diaminohydroxyphosphoribosylaminopyrimidine deaminase/5-amino-6-(5-phosphoribosylamino)uracil reductase
VVAALTDPDRNVAGAGLQKLRAAGIDVTTGVLAAEAERQLEPYLKHRRTGRPWVTLKLAATLDGRTAAADGSSKWITGEEARRDAHRLRADHDAVLVGAGTVRADDPELTVRHVEGNDPLRVVLGNAPPDAKVHPCIELEGDLGEVLDTLGGKGVLSVLVEGGATVAGEFHRQGLVDRYIIYVAPAMLGARGQPLIDGPGPATLEEAWRGEITDVAKLGADLRIELRP